MKDKVSLNILGHICLIGDKIDLLNNPVIAIAINLMMKINLERNFGKKIF